MNTELLIRVNGIQPSYGIEFGFQSPRTLAIETADIYRQANVSYSLLQRAGGKIVRHTLIDVGMGVVPSLTDLQRSHDVRTVDEICLSHPHLDHFAQLKMLTGCLRRSGQPQQPRPVPVYSTRPCWDQGPGRVFPWVERDAEWRPLTPGAPLALGDVTLTPFAVWHGETAPGAVGFVVVHGRRKVVLTCDFLSIPEESRLTGPASLLGDADVVLIESNTWNPAPQTGHQCVLEGLERLRRWRARRGYCIHYSGFEDLEAGGATRSGDAVRAPMNPRQFAEALRRAAPDLDVRLARHGMILGEDEPWGD